tara:strand:+ start:2286 stop:3032 length:747 start_codon:yes stop_codon:yes gene_type:complete
MLSKENKRGVNDHLNSLNINYNDNIVVHSDLRAFGIIDKNLPNFIIKLFLKKIGKKGNLAMPYYNLSQEQSTLVNTDKSKNKNGVLSEYFLLNFNTKKSNSILHSHILSGLLSSKFSKRRCYNSFGKKSDFEFFLKNNFKLILLGVEPQIACTYIHNLEFEAKIKSRKRIVQKYKVLINKKTKIIKTIYPIRKKNYKNNLRKLFFSQNLKKYIITSKLRYGNSYIISLKNLNRYGMEYIKNNKNLFIK